MQNETKEKDFILIDDNEIDLFLHDRLIRLQGISTRIFPFTTVRRALDHLESFQDGPESYKETVILLDLKMPDMDGFEFLDHFENLPQEIRDKTRILIISSSLDFGDLSRSHAHHLIDRCLKKPLNGEDLKLALGELIFP